MQPATALLLCKGLERTLQLASTLVFGTTLSISIS